MDLTELHEIGEKERQAERSIRIRVCVAAGCLSANAQAVKQSLETAVAEAGLSDSVQVAGVGCMRLCSEGPLVAVDPENILYEKVTPADAPSIVAALQGGAPATARQADFNHPFFTKQVPIVLENSGKIDPERIESYIAADGYQPLYHALREMTPGEVVDTITKSGLRGRGGAGYPTGLKWGTVAKMHGDAEIRRLQRRRGRPGRLHGSERPGERPAPRAGRHGHRRLRRRGHPGLHLCPRRVSAGHQPLADRHPAGPEARPAGQPDLRVPLQFPHRPPHRRRGVRLRRGNRPDGLDRGQARHAPPAPALPRRERPVGLPDADQQRRDLRQRPGDHPERGGLVRQDRHREEQGHQGLRPGRQDPEHRPDRGADGHDAAHHRRGDGRRRPGRRQPSRPCRPAAPPAAASRPSRSTRRSITSRWPASARSWAPAA